MTYGVADVAIAHHQAGLGAHESDVVVSAPVGVALNLIEDEFVLEFPVILLDPPALLDGPDRSSETEVFPAEVGQVLPRGLRCLGGPLDQTGFLVGANGLPRPHLWARQMGKRAKRDMSRPYAGQRGGYHKPYMAAKDLVSVRTSTRLNWGTSRRLSRPAIHTGN